MFIWGSCSYLLWLINYKRSAQLVPHKGEKTDLYFGLKCNHINSDFWCAFDTLNG